MPRFGNTGFFLLS